MKYFVLDLEMNPIPIEYRRGRAACKSETIETGPEMLDEDYREIEFFNYWNSADQFLKR